MHVGSKDKGLRGFAHRGAICGTSSTRGNDGSYTSGRAVPNVAVPNIKDAGSTDTELEKILKTARQLDLDSDQRAQLDSLLKAQKDDSATLDKAVQEARAALAHALQNRQTSLESEIENLAAANAKAQESQLRRWAALYSVLIPDQKRRLIMIPPPLSQATALTGIRQAQ